jgi:uncharacterized 2Fe-2S/4Fe-4S cluster protein (DUF4445 family)
VREEKTGLAALQDVLEEVLQLVMLAVQQEIEELRDVELQVLPCVAVEVGVQSHFSKSIEDVMLGVEVEQYVVDSVLVTPLLSLAP